MPKAGRIYEKLVAAIVSTMSPGAKVQYGQWTEGPDGRRDLDVEIRGRIDGEEQFVVIECKDWNVAVGIGVVDALDSKRRDIDADYALICSNTGFTDPALQKAKRVGIGMVAALKSGDKRIKVVIEEEIYTKVATIENCGSTCHFPDPSSVNRIPPNFDPNNTTAPIMYEHLPIVNWIFQKCLSLVADHANAKTINACCKFKEPIIFTFGTVGLLVSAYEIALQVNTAWMAQTITVDASAGIHDFIQHRTIMAPGQQQQYILNGVDFDKWKPIDFIPVEKPLEMNETRISLLLVKNNGISSIEGMDTPNLNSLIGEEIEIVDGKIINNTYPPSKENAVKGASGIEMLVMPIQGERIKLGRNEPCYCGSGKKYKKCHGK